MVSYPSDTQLNLKVVSGGVDTLSVSEIAEDMFHSRMKEFIDQYESLIKESEEMKVKNRGQINKIVKLKLKVKNYRSTYHDIDIGDLH